MSRTNRDDYWFGMAAHVATRATCPRASIGAILVKFDRVVGCGFNGAPEGEPHCPVTPEHMALDHCRKSRHAESNALRNALLPPIGATLYVVGPRPVCVNCADQLRQAGVSDIRWKLTVDTLESVLADVVSWARQTFKQATLFSEVEHLRREAEELAADPTNESEIADVLILLAQVAARQNVDLAKVVSQKMRVNRSRIWGEPDEHGVVEHVRAVRP